MIFIFYKSRLVEHNLLKMHFRKKALKNGNEEKVVMKRLSPPPTSYCYEVLLTSFCPKYYFVAFTESRPRDIGRSAILNIFVTYQEERSLVHLIIAGWLPFCISLIYH